MIFIHENIKKMSSGTILSRPQCVSTKIWASLRTLQWRHNERHGVSNHQPHNCLLNRLFMRRSKKTSKPRVTGQCEGNSPVIRKSPQMASNAELFPFDDVIMKGLPICLQISWHLAVIRHEQAQCSLHIYIFLCNGSLIMKDFKLVSLIKCWSTFWKSNFKQQLGCRFDIMDNESYFFCVLTYAIIHVLIHQIIFRFYLLKYSLFFQVLLY